MSLIVYKLFRKKKNGAITSLFINKTRELPFNEWLDAEPHKTKGYKFRPYWHCTEKPEAPHLSEKGRVWLPVKIDDYEIFERPEHQGGRWYLAKRIKILDDNFINKNINDYTVNDIMNTVNTDHEIITPQDYIVIESDNDDNLKLLEIATTLPRALDVREFYNNKKNGEEYPLIGICKLLDNDELILDEFKKYNTQKNK